MSIRSEQAVEKFFEGYNCAQVVLGAFSEQYGMKREDAYRMATGFGGGIRSGDTCGAVIGAVLVIGLKYGNYTQEEGNTKSLCYQKTAEFTSLFRQRKGSIVCRELLNCNIADPEKMKFAAETGLFKEICPKMIKEAVEILEELGYGEKTKVAFVCVHNSCRSQIAEALGKKFASDVFESYSAGTELKDQINPDAVRMMKELHGIDMEETQYNKLISDIPTPDVVIFMGCNVSCPIVSGQYTENWGLDDPSGKSDEEFEQTIRKIEERVKELKKRI